MGVLGVGLLDARLMGGNGTFPKWEATEREELSASIPNHEHVGATSGCPQFAVCQQGKPGGKHLGWDRGVRANLR